MHYAIGQGNKDVVHLLLKNSADVNITNHVSSIYLLQYYQYLCYYYSFYFYNYNCSDSN